VVLIHHAVIPYAHFGETDAKSWLGFDVVVFATDSFFMAMFFFQSGLFVCPELGNKSPIPATANNRKGRAGRLAGGVVRVLPEASSTTRRYGCLRQ